MGKKSFTPASGGSSETTLPADDIEYNAAGEQVKKKPSASGDVKLSDLGSNGSGSMEEKSYPVCCISDGLCKHVVFWARPMLATVKCCIMSNTHHPTKRTCYI